VAVDTAKLKARLNAKKGERAPHEQIWRDCADYSHPHLGAGFSGQILGATELQTKKARLLNGAGTDGVTTSADGFMGGMTPANALWFGLDAGRETDEEKSWLSDSAMTIWENIHASNFDAEGYDAVLTFIVCGWFALYIDEDDNGGYYFENWPLSQCYIGSSRPGKPVDTIYREWEATVSELVEQYGMAGVSETVRRLAEAGKVDATVPVLWAIEPRRDWLPGAAVSTRLPFASVKMELNTGHMLSESGFHEFPCIVPRWRRIPGTPYALGPMSDALPDCKSANEVARWEFAAAETAIAPPMIAEDDGVLNPRTIKLGPRKIIVANSVNSIKPLVTGANVQFGQMKVTELEAKVRRALMADLFDKVLNDPRMTATQVQAILGMLRQRMGPRFGRLQAEWLQPLVERCYGLALRAGALGRPPETLLQRNYTIRYLSPLARAQKLDEVASIETHEASLLQEAQAVPQVMDTYDWESGARKKAELRGVPADLVPSRRAVEQMREQRAQAQAAAQQAAQQQQVGQAAQMASAEAMASQLAQA
tara:strand:+ start:6749 stop:8362 length:1614 start_codon:yes stop_codon:yes gene_type:complete